MDGDPTALYTAIILQSFEDLFYPRGLDPGATEHDRREALLFLTHTSGQWAQSRRDICDMAGIDATKLRERVISILEGAPLAFPAGMRGQGRRDAETTARNIGAARALWAGKNPPPRPSKWPARVLALLEGPPMHPRDVAEVLKLSVVHATAILRDLATSKKVRKTASGRYVGCIVAAPVVIEPEDFETICARGEYYLKEIENNQAAA